MNNKITITDKFLATTFLKLLPSKVTPNQLTIFRFITIPFVAMLFLLGYFREGMILFSISAFTDALDGALARTKNKITEWGIIYDPLADKLLIGIVAIIVLPKYINLWIIFSIILIEMLIIGAAYHYREKSKRKIVPANIWGKTKMLSQTIGILFVLFYIIWSTVLFLTIAQIILIIAILLAIISLATYSL